MPWTKVAIRVAVALALVAILTTAFVAARTPSLEREWDEDVRVLAGVEARPDGALLLRDVRNWRYTRDASRYLRDVFDHFGTRKVEHPWGEFTRWNLFDLPWETNGKSDGQRRGP